MCKLEELGDSYIADSLLSFEECRLLCLQPGDCKVFQYADLSEHGGHCILLRKECPYDGHYASGYHYYNIADCSHEG